MFSTARARGLERVIISSPSISLPSFLLPAFQIIPCRAFSASATSQSQIGKAPLSIPPEVNFTITPPPPTRYGQHSPGADRPLVTIEGPLGKRRCSNFYSRCWLIIGKLTYAIPNFVKLEYDVAARKAYVSVQDREVRKQREMWGKNTWQLCWNKDWA